jgi:CRP/FNR family transcriptional regulator
MTNRKHDTATVFDLSRVKTACRDCGLHELCLPYGLDRADLAALDRLVRRQRRLKKGELLYRLGEPLRAIYAVRSGSFKATGLMPDGRALVTGFYLPGELLGIDAISSDVHPCSAEALEPSEVCEIPFGELERLAHEIPSLQHQFFRLMSREILEDERLLLMIGRMSAEERLAACLVSLSQRYARLGAADDRVLRLSMSRQDLGDYLGLALETVSRLFSRFQDEGLIEVHGRLVRLLDPARLRALANGVAGADRQHHRA